MSRAFFTDPKAFNPLLPPRQNNRTQPAEVGSKFDVVIVGSGFSGLVASIKLREKGYKIRCYEKGTDDFNLRIQVSIPIKFNQIISIEQ